jgi:hypothetical protein
MDNLKKKNNLENKKPFIELYNEYYNLLLDFNEYLGILINKYKEIPIEDHKNLLKFLQKYLVTKEKQIHSNKFLDILLKIQNNRDTFSINKDLTNISILFILNKKINKEFNFKKYKNTMIDIYNKIITLKNIIENKEVTFKNSIEYEKFNKLNDLILFQTINNNSIIYHYLNIEVNKNFYLIFNEVLNIIDNNKEYISSLNNSFSNIQIKENEEIIIGFKENLNYFYEFYKTIYLQIENIININKNKNLLLLEEKYQPITTQELVNNNYFNLIIIEGDLNNENINIINFIFEKINLNYEKILQLLEKININEFFIDYSYKNNEFLSIDVNNYTTESFNIFFKELENRNEELFNRFKNTLNEIFKRISVKKKNYKKNDILEIELPLIDNNINKNENLKSNLENNSEIQEDIDLSSNNKEEKNRIFTRIKEKFINFFS